MLTEQRNDPIWGPLPHESRRLIVRIDYDDSPEDPCEHDVFKVVSFNHHHASFQHPDAFNHVGMRQRLKHKTAFLLDYFEHGLGRWSLHGTGPQCEWDNAQFAGLLLLTDAKAISPENREERARNFLEVYTNWCNGHVFGYEIETEDGDHVYSCWGFYGQEDVVAAINECIRDQDVVVEVIGECKDIAEYLAIKNRSRD